MQKIFYVSRNEDKAHDGKAPDMDRFQRVEKLNSLIDQPSELSERKTGSCSESKENSVMRQSYLPRIIFQ